MLQKARPRLSEKELMEGKERITHLHGLYKFLRVSGPLFLHVKQGEWNPIYLAGSCGSGEIVCKRLAPCPEHC